MYDARVAILPENKPTTSNGKKTLRSIQLIAYSKRKQGIRLSLDVYDVPTKTTFTEPNKKKTGK